MRKLQLLALAVAILVSACGAKPPTTPTPPPPPVTPPANNLPVVDSITLQGSRSKQPANFADLGETIAVTAKAHDDETAADQLVYVWTATAGTFSGTGANVTWMAPSSAATPADVTITLKVTEKYGTNLAFEHSVQATATLSLHDSGKEVGEMSRQFLLDFSDTNIKDADYIMRNFKAAACPEPHEVQSERDDVIKNYTFYRMMNFRVDQPTVFVNFGVTWTLFRSKKGDAAAVVGVMWDSIDTRDNTRTPNAGTDIIEAAYSSADRRWWLCASDYNGRNLLTGAPFAWRR